MRTREELAWLAGVIDGEGHFGKSSKVAAFTIGQAGTLAGPPDLLVRCRDVLGFGSITGPRVRGDRTNPIPMWFFNTGGFPRVQAVLALVWPWLGPVKRAQAVAVLDRFRHGARHPRAKA